MKRISHFSRINTWTSCSCLLIHPYVWLNSNCIGKYQKIAEHFEFTLILCAISGNLLSYFNHSRCLCSLGCLWQQPIKKCFRSFERVKNSASTDYIFTVDGICSPKPKKKVKFFIDLSGNAMLPWFEFHYSIRLLSISESDQVELRCLANHWQIGISFWLVHTMGVGEREEYDAAKHAENRKCWLFVSPPNVAVCM